MMSKKKVFNFFNSEAHMYIYIYTHQDIHAGHHVEMLIILFFCLSRINLVYMVLTNWDPAPNDTSDSLVKNFTVMLPFTNYLKYALLDIHVKYNKIFVDLFFTF